MAKSDIVDAFLRCLLRHQPTSSPDLLRAIAKELRSEWGGREAYVLKKAGADKAELIGGAIAAGESPTQAIKRAGVSRATGHRLLKRRVSSW